MGTVYTWDEVSRGLIPNIKSFKIVQDIIRSELLECDSVEAAVLYGSVIRGDHNLRSDIDCVVLYDTSREREAMSVMHRIGSAAKRLYVPVNFVPVDTELADSSMHHLGLSFADHVAESAMADGTIKGDFTECLAPTITVKEEISSYVRVKTYKLVEGWMSYTTFSDKQKALFLKKMLESPMHIARKMLHFNDRIDDDSKKSVRYNYLKFGSQEQQELFQRLLELDAWYTTQLERQIEKLHKDEYMSCLKRLSNNIDLAVQFARSNALLLDESH